MKFKPYFPQISGKISQKSSPTVENAALKVNPLYSGNPLRTNFANSEDPDEMHHNAAFHQGLNLL